MPYKDMSDSTESGGSSGPAASVATVTDLEAGTKGALVDAELLKEAIADITGNGGGTHVITQDETNQLLLRN